MREFENTVADLANRTFSPAASADLDARALGTWLRANEAFRITGTKAAATIIAEALAAAEARGKLAGFSEGIEVAAALIQRDWPHDKRVLVPAILALKSKD